MRFRSAILPLLLVFAAGCQPGSSSGTSSAARVMPPAVVDPWVLGTQDALAKEPALLWNGQLGIRIARNGGGVPNAFFTIDSYETEGEEKILALPNPLPELGQYQIDLSKPYSQKLDMRTSELTTTYEAKGIGPVTQTVVMHPTERMIGVRWTVPNGKTVPAGGIRKGHSAPAMEVIVKSEDNWTTYSFGNGKAHFGPYSPVSQPLSFDEISKAARETWKKRWATDIEIDGPVEDQQAVRSFLYYLRSAIAPGAGMSISPYALSSTKYAGHIFWDADIWVFPALMLLDPDAAREIPAYRYARLKAAQEEYMDWLKEGRPTSSGKLGPLPKDFEPWKTGAKFPWESSVSGRETVPGPSKFEHHISGSVHHMMLQAKELGLCDASQATDIAWGTSEFYRSRIEKRPDGRYDLNDVMSPDEHHVGDNDLYTNLLAQDTIDDALWKVPVKQRPELYLPRDAKGFLTYEDDAFRGYKQAAAVLSIYPLQNPTAEKEARTMMERFADKTIENGPAMSDSVHALIWARSGEKQKAYATWRESWEPFTRQPLMLFTEKRRRSEAYFTTGAGGALQTVLFGFLGMRLDYKQEPGSAWSIQTSRGGTLSVKPNLPDSWKSVKLRNFTVNGKRFTLEASASAVRVVPGG